MPRNGRRDERRDTQKTRDEKNEKIKIKPSWRRFFVEHILSFVFIIIAAFIFYIDFQLPIQVPYLNLQLFTGTFFLVSASILILYSELRRNVERYIITSRGVFEEVGYFDKRSTNLPFIKIERCEVEEDFLERIMKIGSVRVDAGEDYFTIKSIAKPKKIRNIIRNRMEESMRNSNFVARDD